MRRLATIVAAALIALSCASQGYAEEDRGSAGYLVALCKTYLDLVEDEAKTLQNLGRTDPARLTAAGVCVGFIVGVVETLRSVNLSCIPKDTSNVDLVRTVLNEIENHPERIRQDFGFSVRAAMMKSWPCRKKKGPHPVSRPTR
jgi:Rap1a immunity proteins